MVGVGLLEEVRTVRLLKPKRHKELDVRTKCKVRSTDATG
jgi:hypothetical protein